MKTEPALFRFDKTRLPNPADLRRRQTRSILFRLRKRVPGNISVEERFYICSFKPAADLFALVIRRHWHVENLLHWVLDVVFREDSLRTREKKALHNLGLIKRFVLSILKILKPYYNMSYNHMRRKIGRKFEEEIPIVFAVLKKCMIWDNLDNSVS